MGLLVRITDVKNASVGYFISSKNTDYCKKE